MKGYGFCEYVNRECGMKAKWALDGHKMYDGQLLACDWLDSATTTTSNLHSKLLYVDCLPQGENFIDSSQQLQNQSNNWKNKTCCIVYILLARLLFNSCLFFLEIEWFALNIN